MERILTDMEVDVRRVKSESKTFVITQDTKDDLRSHNFGDAKKDFLHYKEEAADRAKRWGDVSRGFSNMQDWLD